MKQNMGSTDRIVRFIIAAILIGVTVLTRNWIFGAIALYPLITAIMLFCPAKQAFQFNAN